MSSSSNPFVIREIGPPGSQTAVADFTCPKCGEGSRFTTAHERADGGFVCPHCELVVRISGTRLSDYQKQLDAIDASFGDFTRHVRETVEKAARDLTHGAVGEGAGSDAEDLEDSGDPRVH